MLTRDPVDVCVVGGGVAGALVAALAARQGMRVVVVEAGPRFDRARRFEQQQRMLILDANPWQWQRDDRDRYTDSSPTAYPLNGTRVKGVGGSTLHWGGVAQRLHDSDFRTRSRYGLGFDWPFTYDELEPYYARAERELGVAGDANSSVVRRSSPFPLPAFPDGYGDAVWREGARKLGIRIGPAPYAKNSVPYGDRPACQTFATCRICPIGAQYSADVHIAEAERTGRCEVLAETVARRIELDASGRVRAVHAAALDGRETTIRAAQVVIAAHAVESARLLLLSGVGTRSGELGRNLMEHWYVGGSGSISRRLYPNRIGFHILESGHYYDREDRHDSGAIKLEMGDGGDPLSALTSAAPRWGAALAEEECRKFGHQVWIAAETEHQPHAESRVTLDPEVKDLFGDPVPHIHMHLGEVERRTRLRATGIIQTLLEAAGATDIQVRDTPSLAAHHLGTCRMSVDPDLGVVDTNLRVHGTENLSVVGSAVFPTGGAFQPTLTIAALALRLADRLTGRA
jgi:choline dehydrogenase-like flavoprotein